MSLKYLGLQVLLDPWVQAPNMETLKSQPWSLLQVHS